MREEIKRVVIIEDEPDTAEMYAEMMHLSGYEVTKFFGSTPAIEQIAEHKPAVVILDLMMPDRSGLEVLRFMKENSTLSKVPVIIVSAKVLPADVAEGLEAGASAYLTKPVSFNDLKMAIDQAVN
jgi:two-component system phosphate regulon response regulator PhoB